MDRQTDIWTYRKIDRQIDIQKDRQTDRYLNMCRHHLSAEPSILDKEIHHWKDRQTYRQTDRYLNMCFILTALSYRPLHLYKIIHQRMIGWTNHLEETHAVVILEPKNIKSYL